MSHIYLKISQDFSSIKLISELNVDAVQYVQFACKVVIYLSTGKCSHFGRKRDISFYLSCLCIFDTVAKCQYL